MIEAETQQLLRSKQRHAGLFGGAVALALVAPDTRGNQVLRGALAALGPRQDVVQRKVLGVAVLSAILAEVTVANINARAFHGGLAAIPAYMYIMTQPDYRGNFKYGRWRAENVVPVVFFNKDRAPEPQAHCTRNADGPERFVREVQ